MIKQHSGKHDYDMCHRLNFQPQFFRTDIFKKSVNNTRIKLYNKLPSYLKKSDNITFFKKNLKLFLLAHTFYSVTNTCHGECQHVLNVNLVYSAI
jgi:hypothetical protein